MINREPLDAAMQIQRERYNRGEITKEELRMTARELYEPLVAELIAIGPPRNVVWEDPTLRDEFDAMRTKIDILETQILQAQAEYLRKAAQYYLAQGVRCWFRGPEIDDWSLVLYVETEDLPLEQTEYIRSVSNELILERLQEVTMDNIDSIISISGKS